MEEITHFDRHFWALTGSSPFQWQRRLFRRLVKGEIPSCCDLPTGLGKTSVMTIWLIARARNPNLPRRLVYVVNRRTVVDQATQEAEKLRCRLRAPLSQDLGLGPGTALPVSTLRGELADNGEWRADPSRPAIIVGTVDMIGSKLLFSGYGDGRYFRPHHAGLIGQDTLVIHDEAHLTPAFGELLHGVVEAQHRGGEPEMRPLRVMELSATARARRQCSQPDPGERPVFGLEPEDLEDEIVRQRLDAGKWLSVCPVPKGDLESRLVETAVRHEASGSKVLVYVRRPETAQKVVDGIARRLGPGASDRVALLTGTIRGHERDQLPKEPVFRALLRHDEHAAHHGKRDDHTVYLVSTSAGEVGIDLDADHMVSDLTTLDGMIQRLGRVNRRGGAGRVAEVKVVAEEGSAGEDEALRAAADILARLPETSDGRHDASPRALCDVLAGLEEHEKDAAFARKAKGRPLSDILLDAWSLTSIDEMPGRQPVAPYLHGQTDDPPDTYVAWRKEVALLKEAADVEESAAERRRRNEELTRWFRACPIESRERLRGRTDRVKKALATLHSTHHKRDHAPDYPVIILDVRGRAEWSSLAEVAGVDLAYCTVVLPVEAGGLTEQGTLDGTVLGSVSDVADADPGDARRRERWIVTVTEGSETWKRLLSLNETRFGSSPALREVRRVAVDVDTEGEESKDERRYLVLLASPRRVALDNPELAPVKQTLEEHSRLIACHTRRIAMALDAGDW